MARMGGDQYWLRSKVPWDCGKCGRVIAKGEQMFWYPRTRTGLCTSDNCGKAASREYEAAAADEAMMG
jgi:hypothetical protein